MLAASPKSCTASEIMATLPVKIPPKNSKIEKDRFTVAEKIISIRQNILEKKKMRFSEFFEEDYTRSEMINLFLAVLELLKMQEIIDKNIPIISDTSITAIP